MACHITGLSTGPVIRSVSLPTKPPSLTTRLALAQSRPALLRAMKALLQAEPERPRTRSALLQAEHEKPLLTARFRAANLNVSPIAHIAAREPRKAPGKAYIAARLLGRLLSRRSLRCVGNRKASKGEEHRCTSTLTGRTHAYIAARRNSIGFELDNHY